MIPRDGELSDAIIRKYIMHDNQCNFEFRVINADEAKKLLLSLKTDTPSGVDDLDSKLLRLSAEFVAKPLAYIFNL